MRQQDFCDHDGESQGRSPQIFVVKLRGERSAGIQEAVWEQEYKYKLREE
jgi:hypothetical protein